MGYLAITKKSAEMAYEVMSHDGDPDWEKLESDKGQPPVMDFGSLKSEVEAVREKFAYPLVDGQAAQFEGQLGVVLHQAITDPEMIADPDFWRWLAFRPLLEAVLDRHTTRDRKLPHKNNFGLGSQVENLAYRAWLRADIGYDYEAPPTEKYRLAMRGDQDLWRSHVFRIRYGIHRDMAHALVEFQSQLGPDKPFLKTGDKNDGIRMLAKRLARTQANLAVPALDKEQCLCLIRQLSVGLTLADGTKFGQSGTT